MKKNHAKVKTEKNCKEKLLFNLHHSMLCISASLLAKKKEKFCKTFLHLVELSGFKFQNKMITWKIIGDVIVLTQI